jgi:hypothetical protein
MGGEVSSSYCPFFTLHKKAPRKMAATDILAINNKMMTLICSYFGCKTIFSAGDED